MPQSPIPNRADRIDLQPGNITSRVYNIDPTTGLPTDVQFEIRDSSGNLVYTDTDGNVLFNGLTTFNDLKVENVPGAKKFTKTITQYDLDALIATLDFNISELTGGNVNTINFIPGIGIGEGTSGGFGSGIGFGSPGSGGNGPGGTGIGDIGQININSINDLLDLINTLRDEIDRLNNLVKDCDALNNAVEVLKLELDSVLADNEDLLDLVEALQACKERLERVLTAKNNEVIRLADELARASVTNANLEQKITELEQMNDALRRQNIELASRPEIQVVEVPGTQTVNVTVESQQVGGGGSGGGGDNPPPATGGSGGGGGGDNVFGNGETGDDTLADNAGGNASVAIPVLLKQITATSLVLLGEFYRFINDSSFEPVKTAIAAQITTLTDVQSYVAQSNTVLGYLNTASDAARTLAIEIGGRDQGGSSGENRLAETYDEFYNNLVSSKFALRAEINKV